MIYKAPTSIKNQGDDQLVVRYIISRTGMVRSTTKVQQEVNRLYSRRIHCSSHTNLRFGDHVNPLMGTGNYSATSNNMKLVHWPFTGGLLHLENVTLEGGLGRAAARSGPSSLYQI